TNDPALCSGLPRCEASRAVAELALRGEDPGTTCAATRTLCACSGNTHDAVVQTRAPHHPNPHSPTAHRATLSRRVELFPFPGQTTDRSSPQRLRLALCRCGMHARPTTRSHQTRRAVQ